MFLFPLGRDFLGGPVSLCLVPYRRRFLPFYGPCLPYPTRVLGIHIPLSEVEGLPEEVGTKTLTHRILTGVSPMRTRVPLVGPTNDIPDDRWTGTE